MDFINDMDHTRISGSELHQSSLAKQSILNS